MTTDLVTRLRAAGHDERLATGALYLEAADALSALSETLPIEATRLTIQKAVSDYTRRTPSHLRDCDVLTGHIIRALENAAPQVLAKATSEMAGDVLENLPRASMPAVAARDGQLDKQETPRTDAAETESGSPLYDMGSNERLKVVPASLARQLERELADVKDDYMRLLREKQDALDAGHLPSATRDSVIEECAMVCEGMAAPGDKPTDRLIGYDECADAISRPHRTDRPFFPVWRSGEMMEEIAVDWKAKALSIQKELDGLRYLAAHPHAIDKVREQLGPLSLWTQEGLERHVQEKMADALALLRELNDALVIPGWLQPRVDAVLDQAVEK